MNKLLIRKALFTDIDLILQIEQDSEGTWSYNQFIVELKHEFSLFLVAEYENNLAGYIIAWKVSDEIQLNNIAVKKELRKHGIGSRLLSEMINQNYGQTYTSIFLEVRSRNTNAINFYKDNGFTKTGVRKNYYNDDDAFLMEKKL